jgi:hypothetical protein
MEKIKVIRDSVANSLIVWIGNPEDEYICEETSEEVIIMKNKNNKVIGFEILNYDTDSKDFSVETLFKKAG